MDFLFRSINSKKRILRLSLISLILVLAINSYRENKLYQLKKEANVTKRDYILSDYNFPLKINSGYTKKILVYDNIWSYVRYEKGFGMFRNCRISDCYITDNKNLYPWKDLDAILWDNVFSKNMRPPPIRYWHTYYVLMNREGPARYGGLRKWNVTFNWTMTYRRDSEVPFRYGYVYKLSSPRPLPSSSNKTGLAAWMCSDNGSKSGREQLRKTLQKYMDIDIYGTVGTFSCGKHCRARNGDKCDSQCRDMIGSKYKFYFAFEPSLCHDWSTEKLFTMLQRPIVPVIWSGADLSQLAPPYSAINALDFDTAKDLVDYIKYLDQNNTAYMEYFEWKRNYGVIAGMEALFTSFCELCARLHHDKETQWYTNLHDWWVRGQCTDPNTPRIQRFLNITKKIHLPFPKNGEHSLM